MLRARNWPSSNFSFEMNISVSNSPPDLCSLGSNSAKFHVFHNVPGKFKLFSGSGTG